MTREQAVAIIVQGSGSHFDPQIVAAFQAIQDDLQHVAEQWVDG